MTAPVISQHAGPDGWWRSAVTPSNLPGIHHFADYSEATSFTARRELPHPEPVLIINLGDPIAITDGIGRRTILAAGKGFIAGLDEAPAISESSGRQSGLQVALTPLAAGALLGQPIGNFTGDVIPLDALLDDRDLADALLNAPDSTARTAILANYCAARLHAAAAPPAEITWAWQQLRARPNLSIAALATQTGWSHRRLIAGFRSHIGLTPRRFASITRFDRLIRSAGPTKSWANLAQDAGYFDQPHMVRDFTRFSGMSPSQWLANLVPNGGGLQHPA